MLPPEWLWWADLPIVPPTPPPLPESVPPGMTTLYAILVPLGGWAARYVFMQLVNVYVPMIRKWSLDYLAERDQRRADSDYGRLETLIRTNAEQITQLAEKNYQMGSLQRRIDQLVLENGTLKTSHDESLARLRRESDDRLVKAIGIVDAKVDRLRHLSHDERNEPTQEMGNAIDALIDEAQRAGIKPGIGIDLSYPPTLEDGTNHLTTGTR